MKWLLILAPLVIVVYHLVLLAVGIATRRLMRTERDFFLGGRGLAGFAAAMSYCSSQASAWTMLGLTSIAFFQGVQAVWAVIGTIIGLVVNWYWLAPRIRQITKSRGYITLIDLLAANGLRKSVIRRVAAAILLFSLTFYIASQLQGAGIVLASTTTLSPRVGLLLGAVVVAGYTLAGGFLAVSYTDVIQALLMAITATVFVVAILIDGRLADFSFSSHLLANDLSLSYLSLTGESAGLIAIGFVLGWLGVGMGSFGQPHMLTRLMALRNDKDRRKGAIFSVVWSVLVFGGMLFCGLAARAFLTQGDIALNEGLFFALTSRLFPPAIAGMFALAVLSAIMSTADSQLLVTGSVIGHDLLPIWNRKRARAVKRHTRVAARFSLGAIRPLKDDERHSPVMLARFAIVGVTAVAALLALYFPQSIFNRVLFAFNAIGAAFGPTVIVRLMRRYRSNPPNDWGVIASMAFGFCATVVFYLLPDSPGDFLERIVPFVCAFALLLIFPRKSAG